MAENRRTNSVRQPSIGASIAKIAFGVIFFAVTFSDPGDSDPGLFIAVGLTFSFAMIAWGVLPWLRYHQQEKRLRAEREEERRLQARLRAEKENVVKYCPSCGATSRGKVCEYCGSKLP